MLYCNLVLSRRKSNNNSVRNNNNNNVCDVACKKTLVHMHVGRHQHDAMLLFWSSFMWEDTSAMLHQRACMWEDTNMVWCSSFDPPLCEKTLMRCYISTHACGKILAWAVILRIMILLQAYFDKWSSCDPLSNSEPVCVCVCFFTLFHSLCVCVRMCLALFHNLCVCVCDALFLTFPKLGTKLVVCCLVSKIAAS